MANTIDVLANTDSGWQWVGVTGFSEQDTQYVPGRAEVKPRLQKCTYCGSRCEDIRGNCGACGAPFEDEGNIILRLPHPAPPHVEHGKKY